MLTDEELLTAFSDIESDRVERKRNAGDIDRIRQFVCAMANDLPGHRKPGVIFIGQEDDLSCTGLPIDDGLLTRLAQLRDDGLIQPLPAMSVERRTLSGCTVAVITVDPSANPPVKADGRVWIRVGPRRALATGQEERRLLEKRRWGDLPFDAQPVTGSTLNDLDLARFKLELLPAIVPPDTIEENDRPDEQQLRSLRLVDNDGVPTISGILFLGKSPQSWLPGAYVQFRRVNGGNLTDDTLDHQTVAGTLPDQALRIDDILRSHIRVSADVGGIERIERQDFPIEALRQLVRNALIHRAYDGTNAPVRVTWYSDRIEIQSPGGPYGAVTWDNFGQGVTDYRNPNIAALMLYLKFVERFGVRIGKARRALERNRNPPLEFDKASAHHVLAVVRAKP
jgi:ATP-dependent DNA helicase RecG